MIFIDEIKKQIGIMLHPGSMIKKGMKIEDALVYYYKLSVMPLVIYIILGIVFPNSVISQFSGITVLSGIIGNLKLLVVLWGVVFFWILAPVGLFVDAAIFQFFGKLIFKAFKGDYKDTFTAFTYAASTTALVYWLTVVPILSALLVVFWVWELVVLIIGVANLHKMSRWKSLGVLIATTVIIVIIAIIIGALFALSFSSVLHAGNLTRVH